MKFYQLVLLRFQAGQMSKHVALANIQEELVRAAKLLDEIESVKEKIEGK